MFFIYVFFTCMKISPIYSNNYKYINPQSFGAFHNVEKEQTNESKSGLLVHISKFFREPETDEFVQDYVLKNFSKDNKVKVVSGGCSAGEEAYSYYVMLDSLKDKLEVEGFDLSQKSINEARKGIYRLSYPERDILDDKCSMQNLTPYTARTREQFRKHFRASDWRVYELYPYFLYNPNDTRLYERKDEMPNCKFFKGDVLNIDKMFEKNSVNVFLLRNMLYLVTCEVLNSGLATGERQDAKNTINSIAKQLGEVVKPKGLVVFGENEQFQMVNIEYITDAMTKNGFEPVIRYKNKEDFTWLYGKRYSVQNKYSHIWKKKAE